MTNLDLPQRDHVILVLPFTAEHLTNPSALASIIRSTLPQAARESFTVLLTTPDGPGASSDGPRQQQLYASLRQDPRRSFAALQTFLCRVYTALVAAQMGARRILMDVEVHLDGELGGWEEKLFRQTRVAGDESRGLILLEGVPLPAHLAPLLSSLPTYTLPSSLLSPPTPLQPPPGPSRLAPPAPDSDRPSSSSLPSASALDLAASDTRGPPVVAVGGTFDHLHAAHKLLLHLSFFLASESIIVGIMADSLLRSKSNAELVQSLEVRLDEVQRFLRRLGGVLPSSSRNGEHEEGWAGVQQGQAEPVVISAGEITDGFGPTRYKADIHALVVSRETISGGTAVNTLRAEKGLGELELYVVDVIPNPPASPDRREPPGAGGEGEGEDALDGVVDEGVLKERKMGSTGIRRWIYEQGLERGSAGEAGR